MMIMTMMLVGDKDASYCGNFCIIFFISFNFFVFDWFFYGKKSIIER